MRISKLLAALVLSAAVLAPSLANAHYRHHRWHYARYVSYYGYVQWYPLPYHISYRHNYGPGYVPGTFAYYDGPTTNHCYQGSAAYRGQGGIHPCF